MEQRRIKYKNETINSDVLISILINFKKSIASSDNAGMKYFFCQEDSEKGKDDVITSYNNLKKIL
jgi:hypothetical protein